MTGPATDAAELAAEELMELLLEDTADFDELLDDTAFEELLDDIETEELTALDAEELGTTEAALDDDGVKVGALDELLGAILATDDFEDDATDDTEDELTTFAPTGAAAVSTNTDLMADQLHRASPTPTPYK